MFCHVEEADDENRTFSNSRLCNDARANEIRSCVEEVHEFYDVGRQVLSFGIVPRLFEEFARLRKSDLKSFQKYLELTVQPVANLGQVLCNFSVVDAKEGNSIVKIRRLRKLTHFIESIPLRIF